MSTEWHSGVWVGRTTSTDEHIVIKEDKRFKARTTKRLPNSKREEARLFQDLQAWAYGHAELQGQTLPPLHLSPQDSGKEEPKGEGEQDLVEDEDATQHLRQDRENMTNKEWTNMTLRIKESNGRTFKSTFKHLQRGATRQQRPLQVELTHLLQEK